MVEVKRAHMLSKAYLRPWADARNRVDVLDVLNGRGFTSAIENATVVRHAYDPAVLTRDLESDYARIEDRGMRAIVKLRNDHALTSVEQQAMVAFLDMHLDRGRYADQADITTPALVLRTDWQVDEVELRVGDRLLLAQWLRDVTRLSVLELERWPWRVHDARHLATGDGAVLFWRQPGSAEMSSISFPLSPTRLLVLGASLPVGADLNATLAANSRRWIVGTRGSLNLEPFAARRRQ